MADRFCPHCGFSVADSERFCLQCGSEVRDIPEDQVQSSRNGRAESESTGGLPDEDEASSEPPRRSVDQSQSSDGRSEAEGDSQASTAALASYEAEVKPGEPPPEDLRPRTDEHEWQGKLFVGLNWAGFIVSALGALFVFLATLAGEFEAGTGLLVSVLLAGASVFLYWFNRAIRDFDRRGWNALWVVLFLSGLGYLADMGSGGVTVVRGLIGLVLTLIWGEYFWRIRDKYGKRTKQRTL